MKTFGCFHMVIIAIVVMTIGFILTSAAMTLFKQIKEALRKPDTVTVASADFLSVITNRLDSVTIVTYTLKETGDDEDL